MYSFFNLGVRWKWVVNAMPWPHYPPERDLVPIVRKVGWASMRVWMAMENLASTEASTPDSPACRESLYDLSCPSHHRVQ